jgi:hypothetical protein
MQMRSRSSVPRSSWLSAQLVPSKQNVHSLVGTSSVHVGLLGNHNLLNY